MRQPHRTRTLTIVIALLLTLPLLAACDLLPEEATMPDDGPAPVISQEAAIGLVSKSLTASQNATNTGVLSLTITDDEATSLLNIGNELAQQMRALQGVESASHLEQLQQSGAISDLAGSLDIPQLESLLQGGERLPQINLPDLSFRTTIEEPRVRFTADGHVILRGYAELRGYRQPIRLVMAPRASGGELELDFVKGQLGPVDVPEAIFDLVGTGLASILMAGQDLAEITDLKVSDGVLTLSGRKNF